jgi:hypothetical protein
MLSREKHIGGLLLPREVGTISAGVRYQTQMHFGLLLL